MLEKTVFAVLLVIIFIFPACSGADDRDDRFSAEKVLKTYMRFFPDRIKEVQKRRGDWAARIGSGWYYFADRKFLPESELAAAAEYAPYAFYPYRSGLPVLPELTETQKQELLERAAERDLNPPSRYPGFFNALWQIYDPESSRDRITGIIFLGRKIEVHERLSGKLLEISALLEEAAQQDTAVKAYISSINSASAFNYRKISATDSLSFHSYGIALDIQEKSSKNKALYWLWTRKHTPVWFDVPLEERYSPPQKVIDTFEKFGFIWGGKWLFFDGMHFEYRPEILALNNIPVE